MKKFEEFNINEATYAESLAIFKYLKEAETLIDKASVSSLGKTETHSKINKVLEDLREILKHMTK